MMGVVAVYWLFAPRPAIHAPGHHPVRGDRRPQWRGNLPPELTKLESESVSLRVIGRCRGFSNAVGKRAACLPM